MRGTEGDPTQGLRTCTRCNLDQAPDKFPPNRRKKDGLDRWCRTCMREYMVSYREANRDQLKAKRLQRYADNPEAARTASQRYYYENRSAISANRKVRYREDPQPVRARVEARRLANPEAARKCARDSYKRRSAERIAQVARWKAANREKVRESARRSNYRRRALEKASRSARYTKAELAARMSMFGDACWICGGPFEHVDHVKPLSRGGPDVLANLAPACVTCNLRKSNRWPFHPSDIWPHERAVA